MIPSRQAGYSTEPALLHVAARLYHEAVVELDATGIPNETRAELRLVAAFMVQRAY
ncbi:MAG: hypothetical protein HYX92_13795 [Chloroflexi bacterium]|nr:hypothetical protein [Chloroflexota bacterium]